MILAMIPCRLGSKRLPNKPLLKINGLTILQHVISRTLLSKEIDGLVICTEDKKIFNLYQGKGYKSILTKKNFNNGTERIASVAKKFKKIQLIIDMQCDNIFLNPKHLDRLIKFHLTNKQFDIVVPHSITGKINDTSIVKLVVTGKKVIYMSRKDVPHGFKKKNNKLKKHLDFISFKPEALQKFLKLKKTSNEQVEGIELLRAVENNFSVGTFEVKSDLPSINTKQDLIVAKKIMHQDKIRKLY